jgi:hypothetical protein
MARVSRSHPEAGMPELIICHVCCGDYGNDGAEVFASIGK